MWPSLCRPTSMIVCVMAQCRDFLHHLRDGQHVNKVSATHSLSIRVKFSGHVNKTGY
jgi:hypothetical protein